MTHSHINIQYVVSKQTRTHIHTRVHTLTQTGVKKPYAFPTNSSPSPQLPVGGVSWLCVHNIKPALYIYCTVYKLSIQLYIAWHSQPSGWQTRRVCTMHHGKCINRDITSIQSAIWVVILHEQSTYCYCLLAVGLLSTISKVMVCLPLLMPHLIHHIWTACPMG